MNHITLDYINNIIVVPEFSTVKSFHSLKILKYGLQTLASSVRYKETERYENPINFSIQFDNKDILIACFFHWFANSLINYAGLIAFVDVMNKNMWAIENLQDLDKKKQVKDYRKKYISEVPELQKVLLWRNKISAHFAATDPLNNDSLGTLQDSIQHPIVYKKPYYYANLPAFGLGGSESVIPGWSLTETFELLSSRYWIDYKLEQFTDLLYRN